MQTHDELSLAVTRRIDEVCDQFERSCRTGQTLELSTLVEGWCEPQRSVLIRELVLIDLDYTSLQGVDRDPGHYLARLPHDLLAIEKAFLEASDGADGSTLNPSNANADSTDRSAQPATDECAEQPEAIGRYRVESQLGAGSFGIVYLAIDPDLGRQVAIKCPKREVNWTESHWEMLQREAAIAAKFRHPGVVAIHDIGRDESGRPYFVMEYIHGESLKDLLSRGQIEIHDAVRIAVAVADALESIHKAGLVHRDLKPANIILDDGGEPHIADLGLALDEQQSMEHELAGTLAYMAPEQVRVDRGNGQSKTIDHRCDIWAFGVMLYEMLVGQRPFHGATSAQLFRQILHHAPVPPSSLNPRIRPAITTICVKCLANAPESRFESAGAVAEALRQASNITVWSGPLRRKTVLAACVLSALALLPMIDHLRSDRDSATVTSAIDSHAAAPVPEVLSFVIKDSGERFADLAAAVAAAPDGVVEVDADGPLSIDQVEIGNRPISICAAPGRRPVLTLADESQRCMFRTAGALSLERLEIRRGTPARRARGDAPAIILVNAPGSLQVSRCRLVVASDFRERWHCIQAAGDCRIENSEFANHNGGAVMWFPDNGDRLVFDNCVAGVANLAIIHSNHHPAANVQIRRSTVVAEQGLVIMGKVPLPSESKLSLMAKNCYFDVDAVLTQVITRAGLFPDQTLTSLTSAITWEGEQNAFLVRDTFVRGKAGRSLHVNDLATWNQLWGTTTGSIEVSATERSADSGALHDSIPDRLSLAVRDENGLVGIEAGANLASIGPEAGY